MAKISTYPTDSTPQLSDKVIGTDVNDSNETKNYLLSDIYNLFVSQGGGGGYVPYTGATNNVDLGSNDITADSFIANGGTSSGFLKADGSIDTTAYVTVSTNQTITGSKTFTDDTVFNSEVSIPNITQAVTEVDKILVSDAGVVKYRTATEILNEQIHYGSFYDTTDQIGGTVKAMTFNSTDIFATNGVSIANNSQITFPKPGVYNVDFSAQFVKSGGSDHNIYIWLKIGNTNVPDSATWLQMANNNDYLVAAWNFLVPIQTAGDYCEIYWYTNSTDVQIAHIDTGLPVGVPNVPSIILTVNQVG